VILARVEQEAEHPPRREPEPPRSLRERARQRPPVRPEDLPRPGDYKQRDFNECEDN
jgi:hypothetical protein